MLLATGQKTAKAKSRGVLTSVIKCVTASAKAIAIQIAMAKISFLRLSCMSEIIEKSGWNTQQFAMENDLTQMGSEWRLTFNMKMNYNLCFIRGQAGSEQQSAQIHCWN